MIGVFFCLALFIIQAYNPFYSDFAGLLKNVYQIAQLFKFKF